MKLIRFLVISFLVFSLQVSGDFLHQFSHYLEKNKESISWNSLGRFIQNPASHGNLPISDKDSCAISNFLGLLNLGSPQLHAFHWTMEPPAHLLGFVSFLPEKVFISQFIFLSFDSRAPPFVS